MGFRRYLVPYGLEDIENIQNRLKEIEEKRQYMTAKEYSHLININNALLDIMIKKRLLVFFLIDNGND